MEMVPRVHISGSIGVQKPSICGRIHDSNTLSGLLTIPLETYTETYDGPYSVEASVHGNKILETKDKKMAQNVVIIPPEYSEVSNTANGLTVYIGKDI